MGPAYGILGPRRRRHLMAVGKSKAWAYMTFSGTKEDL